MEQDIPKILYHYCSLQGLLGIIKDKHLRMTSVFWMDDTTEFYWLYEVVSRLIEELPSEESNTLHKHFLELSKARIISHIYCTSFSAVHDSRSQWLEYADNGHGFCIGFDPSTFEMRRTPPMRHLVLEPVIYDENEQEGIAKEIIGFLQENDNSTHNQLNAFIAEHNAWWKAPSCKNPVFKNENEWRLLFRDNPEDALHFFMKADRHLVPFVEFPLDPAKKPIREIWVGPRNLSQRNVDAISQLLEICGYDIREITFPCSRVPLRLEY